MNIREYLEKRAEKIDAVRAGLIGLGAGTLASSFGKDKDKRKRFVIGTAVGAPLGYFSGKGIRAVFRKKYDKKLKAFKSAQAKELADLEASYEKKLDDLSKETDRIMDSRDPFNPHGQREEYEKRFKENLAKTRELIDEKSRESNRLSYEQFMEKRRFEDVLNNIHARAEMRANSTANLFGPTLGTLGAYRHFKKTQH